MQPLQINRQRVTLLLVIITLALATASLSLNLVRYYRGVEHLAGLRLVNVDQEGNIPTYYSALLLATAALLLWLIGRSLAVDEARFGRPWKALAAIFLYLSVDEAVQLHEYGRRFHPSWLPQWSVLYWPWVIFGAMAVIVVVASFLRFVLHLPPATRRGFITAGIVYVTGALGVEMVGATIFEEYAGQPPVILATTIEETLEMLGVVLLIHTLLGYIASHPGGLTINVSRGAGVPATPRLADIQQIAPAFDVSESDRVPVSGAAELDGRDSTSLSPTPVGAGSGTRDHRTDH